MLKNIIARLLLILLAISGVSCARKKPTASPADAVVIAVANDFDHLNPLLIQLSISREACILIYPKLIVSKFDDAKGESVYAPCLATRWEFSPDGKRATFFLRNDAVWNDGKKITSADLKFSYQLYANPLVASTRQSYAEDFVRDKQGRLDFENGVQTPNDTTLILNFQKPLAPNIVLDHFYDLMPVAKHIFEGIDPKDIRAKAAALPIVGGGAFKVERWEKQRELVLVSNPTSVLPHPAKLNRLVFRVIPEYATRLTALKAGEVDVVMATGGIMPRDADEIAATNPNIDIKPVKHRNFDSVVWLNIDGDAYRENGTVKPNVFFGDVRVRQAMSYGINRQAVIDGFMGRDRATLVNTSLSPAFKSILVEPSPAFEYNPDKAKALLAEAGWKMGQSGVLEKDGRKFSFVLASPNGNQRRSHAAAIVQQDLKKLGIECNLRYDEQVIFNQSQNDLKYDAAIAGLSAETLPFQLIIWDDFRKMPFNSACFQHPKLAEVISKLAVPQPKEIERALWREFQTILNEEQPRTFLYYFDELEGFNKRVKNVEVSMVAILINAHEWTL